MSSNVENIFSFAKKKEKKQQEKAKIFADSREKNSLVIAHLHEQGTQPILKKLDVGDYLIGEVLIERKTKTDLLNSLKSHRLKNQIKDLKQYKHPLFIIEEDNHELTQHNADIINGVLLSIAAHHQIPFIHTGSEKHTAQTLIHITQKEKKESAINPKKAPKTRKEIQRFILEAFPGVGPKASQKLLETFHTLQNIFAAQKKDIEKVTNKRVAASICELLR